MIGWCRSDELDWGHKAGTQGVLMMLMERTLELLGYGSCMRQGSPWA